MAVKWRVANVPETDKAPRWTDPLGATAAIDAVISKTKGHRGDGFRIRERERDDAFGHVLEINELGRRLRPRIINGQIGDLWAIRCLSDDHLILVRKVKTKARVIDTAGNDRIDRIHTALWRAFPNLESWGIYVCRHIDWNPAMPWSQHAYANAEDIHASVDRMDDVAHWLLHQRNEQKLPIGPEILWRGRNLVTGNAVGDHFDHVHYIGEPSMNGVPACA